MGGYSELYAKSDSTNKEVLYNNLVASYLQDISWAKEEFDDTRSYVADIYQKNLGLSKKRFFKDHSSFRLNLTKYTSVILYLSFMFSFLFALVFFAFSIKLPA